jgi:large subunit ribosomal protein L24
MTTSQGGQRRRSLHIKKGDQVIVISGKDRGVTGKVISTNPEKQRVLVEGVNRIKRHTKVTQTQRGSNAGGIITQEAPVHVSNVMLVTDVGGKKVGTRVGYRRETVELANGRTTQRSVRVARRTGEDI